MREGGREGGREGDQKGKKKKEEREGERVEGEQEIIGHFYKQDTFICPKYTTLICELNNL